MPDPRRILLIRPSALGDVCRTVPALVSLRRRFPEAQIDWLVRDAYAPAIAAHPALSNLIPFPRSRFARAWHSPAAFLEFAAWLRALAPHKYDAVYDLQGLFRSAVFALATRAPRRVGRTPSREFAFLGHTHRHPVPRDAHDVDATLAILEADGVPPIRDLRLYTSDAHRAGLPPAASALLGHKRYAVLAPTSRWPGKRWPIDRFAALARALLDRGLVDSVAVVGAPGEQPQCAQLLSLADADPRIIDLVGQTSVGGLLAVIERAALVVANDSAALHMAVGFDRPLVALFGPTRIARVGPYGRERDVLQHVTPADRLDHKHAPSGLALMERISEAEAIAAAQARLSPSALSVSHRALANPTIPTDAAVPL